MSTTDPRDAIGGIGSSGENEHIGSLDSASPIGIFDSGFGGLTVLGEIMRALPNESTVFVGDSARCPYGPRPLDEVRGYVMQICSYLRQRGCKLIMFACNTATAAGLRFAQPRFDIPLIGVVQPGARAAVDMTRTRRVGVIATEGTVASGAYEDAIHNLDAGIRVFSAATPKFVEIVEQCMAVGGEDNWDSARKRIYYTEEQLGVAREYLEPLRGHDIDTLVLGCTHFPLISHLVSEVMGPDVRLVSSAEETAAAVKLALMRRGELAPEGASAMREYFTTSENVAEFKHFGELILDEKMRHVAEIDLEEYAR